MSAAIEIDGRKMLPITEVIAQVSYSRDYVTRLARERKIEATHVGRQWFIELESLERYSKMTAAEKELRKQKLSAERKREKEIHDAVKKQKSVRARKARTLNTRAAVTASLVLTLGLLGGTAIFDDTLVTHLGFEDKREANVALVSSASPETVVYEANPSGEIKPLGEIKLGVLLMPEGGDLDSPNDLFSDEVEVITTSNGTKAIVLLDENGDPVGNRIPFVEVPVNQSNI